MLNFGIAAMLAVLLAVHPAGAAADDAGGVQETGESQIAGYPCGELLCGGPVVLEERRGSIRSFPLLGALPLMAAGLIAGSSISDGKPWIGGTFYDPRLRKAYRYALFLDNDGTRKGRGYFGVPLSQGGMVWIRPQ